MMRRIAALEMIGVYIALVFLLYAIWYWRHRVEVYVIGIFCTGMMLIYSISITNVGALYRMRYGFMMTLVALGVAGGLAAWQELHTRWRLRVPLPHTLIGKK